MRPDAKEPRCLRVETIDLQREEGGPWETAVIVNEGDGPIIDLNGKVVEKVWNWRAVSVQVMTIIEQPGRTA